MKNTDLKKMPRVGVLHWSSLFSEDLRLPKKLDLRGTPLEKNVAMLANHVIFSSMLEVLHRSSLGL
jgi:hypothetical protein